MIIKSKYDVGDKCWFMISNRPKCMDVRAVEIVTAMGQESEIEYTFKITSDCELKLKENELFETKEDLLNTL